MENILQGVGGVNTIKMNTKKKFTIGIAAMEAKARSKPMRNILQRLLDFDDFEAIIFGDKVILDESVENWPACDFLISFFSTGFPLDKAIEYVKIFKPFCINDLVMQKILFDRRMVLRLLDCIGVPTPKRIVVDRDGGVEYPTDVLNMLKSSGLLSIPKQQSSRSIIEVDHDVIETPSGERMVKPFVEKPVEGEDHNIWIYYPQESGGGVRKLFRKIANKSSEFEPETVPVRKDKSYVYEEFMDVDNAEDVKVYTVGPSIFYAETRKAPTIDGIVRRNPDGKEVRYVTSLSIEEQEIARKICSTFKQNICGFDLLRVKGKSYVIDVNGWSFVKGNDKYYNMCAQTLRKFFLDAANLSERSIIPRSPSIEGQWRLKGYMSIFRHGDRTPKQKLKFFATYQPFVDLMNGSVEEVVLKNPDDLKRVIVAAEKSKAENEEDATRLEQLQTILLAKIEEPGTKIQMKPYFSKDDGLLEKLQIIVKWGGEFTHAGAHQSKDLGENMRKDLQILNKDLLNDVKCFSSSERRVLATTDVFLKSFFHSEDIPQEMNIVRKDMLDDSFSSKELSDVVKNKLRNILNSSKMHRVSQRVGESQINKDFIDPTALAKSVTELLRSRREIMRNKFNLPGIDKVQQYWCCSESPELFLERWERLFSEFCDNDLHSLSPSRIPELYDSLKYDALHNRTFIEHVFVDESQGPDPKAPLRELYHLTKMLVDFVGPREYGITDAEKLQIGILSSSCLLKQLIKDFKFSRNTPEPYTRFYFTKESRVRTLYNIIRLCLAPNTLEVPELDYLTQITFEIYERNRNPLAPDSDKHLEYTLRVAFSPGAHDAGLIDTQMNNTHALAVAPRKWLTEHISLDEVLSSLDHLIRSTNHLWETKPKLLKIKK